MKNLIALPVYLITAILFLAGCAKNGDPGPAGKDGNANVRYSDWVNYNPQYSDASNKRMYLYDSKITNSFVDSGGLVLGFVRLDGADVYQAPFMKRYDSESSPLIEINAHAHTTPPKNNVTFECYRADGGVLQTDFTNRINTTNLQVRYFLITGNLHLRLAGGTTVADYYRSKSYEEICAMTGANP